MKSNALGDFIKTRRMELNINQRVLGDHLGVTTQFISNIERGVSLVPLSRIPKLIQMLDIHHDFILQLMVEDYSHNLKNSYKAIPTPETMTYGSV